MKKLNEYTDEELLAEAKKMKSNRIIVAGIIGLILGTFFYGIYQGNLSLFFGAILLILVSKISKKSNIKKAELNKILKERNLK